MTDLAKLVVKLEAQTAQYDANLKRAVGQLRWFKKSQDQTLAGIGKGFLTAAAAIATGFVAMAKQSIDAADRMRDLAQQSGAGVEALSELAYGAKLSGVDVESLAKGLGKLSISTVEAAQSAKSKAAKAFQQLNVDVKDAAGGVRDADKVLVDVADRFAQMQDGAAKAALATQLFGKAGRELIPFLNEGRSGIEAMRAEAKRLGITLTQEAADAADRFNDNLDKLKLTADGLVRTIVGDMLPMLNKFAEDMLESSQKGEGFASLLTGAAGATKILISGFVLFKGVIQKVERHLLGIGFALANLAKFEFRGALTEIQQADEEAKAMDVADAAFITNLWKGTIDGIADHADRRLVTEARGRHRFRPTVIDEDAAKEAEAAAKKAASERANALKQLGEMNTQLQQQVDTFGMSAAATAEYSIRTGELADEFEKAGAAAEPFKESIVSLTAKAEGQALTAALISPLETYRKTLDSLTALQNQGAGLSPETLTRGMDKARAEFLGFSDAVAVYRDRLAELQAAQDSISPDEFTRATEAAAAAAGGIIDPLTQYTAKLNELAAAMAVAGPQQEQFARATEDAKAQFLGFGDPVKAYTDRMDQLREALVADKISQTEFNQAAQDAREALTGIEDPLSTYQERIERLNDALAAGAIQQEEYKRQVKLAQDTFDQSILALNPFLQKAAENTQDIIADALINGFDDGAKGMLRTFVNMLLEMQAQALAAKIASTIFGGGSTGGKGWLGLIVQAAGAYFGGGVGAAAGAATSGGISGSQLAIENADSGGRGMAGIPRLIGVGAQPELFVPDTAGTFFPRQMLSRDAGGRGYPGSGYMIGKNAQPETFLPDKPASYFSNNQQVAPQVTVSPQIINVRDVSEIPTAMQSAEGERAIINVINRNPGVIRGMLQR